MYETLLTKEKRSDTRYPEAVFDADEIIHIKSLRKYSIGLVIFILFIQNILI